MNNSNGKHIFPTQQSHPPIDRRLVAKFVKANNKEITVTHVTIRQSIFFLILKLIAIELFAALVLIAMHSLFFASNFDLQFLEDVNLFNIPVFLTLVAIKTFITFYVIFQWLDEYYEITPKEIIHNKGFFLKHEEHHALNHLVSLRVSQGAFGRLFNFGTIVVFNWAKNKELYLYLIHNPMKYAHILENLLPEPDEEKAVLRERLIEEEDESDASE